MNHHETGGRTPWWRSRGGIAFVGFLAIAGFFLLTEHRAHVLGAAPLLLLALCPLLHLFGHGGHNHGGEPPTTPGKEEVGGVGNKPPTTPGKEEVGGVGNKPPTTPGKEEVGGVGNKPPKGDRP